MAKYTVKMACGHTETVELFGKMADRERKIAWLEEHGTCSACYKANLAAKREADTAAAAQKAVEENLPTLTGSEKQINWAMSIRAQLFADLDKMIDDANSKTADEQIKHKNNILKQATRNVLVTKTDARFWIDNRNRSARQIIATEFRAECKAEYDRLSAEVADEVVEADVADYAVSPEAQDVAIEAEIEQATMTADETDDAEIQRADFYDFMRLISFNDNASEDEIDAAIADELQRYFKPKQLLYDCGNNVCKKATHTDGKKFYFVRWDYRDNCDTYYLTYTRDSVEDEKLLADGRWERISRSFAMKLVKRGGHKYDDNVPMHVEYTAYDFREKTGWLPIAPYFFDADADFDIDIRARLVVQPQATAANHYSTCVACKDADNLLADYNKIIADIDAELNRVASEHIAPRENFVEQMGHNVYSYLSCGSRYVIAMLKSAHIDNDDIVKKLIGVQCVAEDKIECLVHARDSLQAG